MKRSKTVALSLMSASAVLLQACNEREVEAQVFRDARNCVEAGELTQDQCAELQNAAVSDHLQNAPRYRSAEDCYAEYGPEQCQGYQTTSGGSVWLPLMMGFMAGRMMDGFGRRSSTPLYRADRSSDSLRTPAGYTVNSGYGAKVKLPEWATKPARTSTRSVGRGGFGSRSYGWGG